MLSGAGEGEGEGGGAGLDAGCFPDLYDSADFKSWLDGTYQGTLDVCGDVKVSNFRR